MSYQLFLWPPAGKREKIKFIARNPVTGVRHEASTRPSAWWWGGRGSEGGRTRSTSVSIIKHNNIWVSSQRCNVLKLWWSVERSPLVPWECVVPVWPWRSCPCRWFWAADSCRYVAARRHRRRWSFGSGHLTARDGTPLHFARLIVMCAVETRRRGHILKRNLNVLSFRQSGGLYKRNSFN